MPHECTNCGLAFPDGSKEMLSGCPDCGGNKFQFRPDGAPPAENTSSPAADSSPTDDPSADSSPTDDPSGTRTPSDTRPDSESSPESFALGSLGSGEDDAPANSEDHAQTSARSTVPSGSEYPPSDSGKAPSPDPSSADPSSDTSRTHSDRAVGGSTEAVGGSTDNSDESGTPTDLDSSSDPDPDASDDPDTPDISKLREELNEQFESIKIHAPGEYELNLMELYDREEHIIALQEDGRYVIDVPSSWRDTDEDD
jgi:predicted  nucleic acid-binding Zn-ribbon protein